MSAKLTRLRWIKDYLFKKYAPEIQGTVIDAGAGSEWHIKHLSHCEYISIDLKGGCDIRGDAHKLPFADAIVDGVLCMEVLEHCVDPFTAMEEISRILKPNGLLILSTPFLYPEHDTPTDYWRFTWNSIPRLLKDNFITVAKHKTGFGPIYAGWFVVAKRNEDCTDPQNHRSTSLH